MTGPDPVPLISRFSELAPNYDALLCDVWGVLHNGKSAYQGVAETLRTYRAQGGHVLLLSNAPRPSSTIPGIIGPLGIPPDAYDDILTSGDATHEYLASHAPGTACYHIGPIRDLPLFEKTGVDRVGETEATFILVTGPFDDEVEGPDDYRVPFESLIARDLPMVCANPDIVVERGHRLIYCAGALARLYAEMGGRVTYFGKPHAPIYGIARERVRRMAERNVDDHRLLAVGDGLMTDITGANQQALDALFITGGISAEECGPDAEHPDAKLVSELLARHELTAIGAMPRFIW